MNTAAELDIDKEQEDHDSDVRKYVFRDGNFEADLFLIFFSSPRSSATRAAIVEMLLASVHVGVPSVAVVLLGLHSPRFDTVPLRCSLLLRAMV